MKLVIQLLCTVILIFTYSSDFAYAQGAKFPVYLTVLKNSDTLSGKSTGLVGAKSESYLAFEKAAAQGSKIRKELEWLLNNASPSGRLYAALLLMRIDKKVGEAAFLKLQSDKEEVMFMPYGCGAWSRKVSDIAKQLKKNQNDFL